jgi:hypothetical protein
MKAFDLWSLDTSESLGMLSLLEDDSDTLSRYREGVPLSDHRIYWMGRVIFWRFCVCLGCPFSSWALGDR